MSAFRPTTALAWTALLALLPAACTAPASTTAIELPDLDGSPARPLAVAPGEVHVIVFTSQECPIANAYAPILAELAGAWQQRPVRLFLVHVDPELSPEAARQHAHDYRLPGTVLLDPGHRLAATLGATITPEAVVWTVDGVRYRGRIDDQWRRLGSRAPAAGQHDLRDAVDAVLRGQPVREPFPPAVGCLLPEPARN